MTSVHELPQELGRIYGAIATYLAEIGEQPSGAPFAAYYNMDMDNLDVEIGFPVARPLPATESIAAGQIPARKVATTVFTGPYLEVKSAYTALAQWVQQQGLEPTGVAYEFYLNDPSETPSEKLQTQVVFPLR